MLERGDFGLAQSALVLKFSVSRFRLPGWHVTLRGCCGNQSRTLGCILIRDERDRSDLAGSMTGNAIFIQYGCDVTTEGHFSPGGFRRECNGTAQRFQDRA